MFDTEAARRDRASAASTAPPAAALAHPRNPAGPPQPEGPHCRGLPPQPGWPPTTGRIIDEQLHAAGLPAAGQHPARRATHPTAILAAHNGDLDDESDRLYLNPDGRPYQLHTTNPLGRFDRWVIGGRWHGRFVATPDARPAQLIHPERVGDKWRCAGGLLHALDLAGMRADAAAVADAAYDRWEPPVDGTPTPAQWQVSAARHHADPDAYPHAAPAPDSHNQ